MEDKKTVFCFKLPVLWKETFLLQRVSLVLDSSCVYCFMYSVPSPQKRRHVR